MSVAEPPWWMTEGSVVRLVAFAGGTTLTIKLDVTLGPVEGVTVNVYVSAPLALPVTVTLPPFAMVVAERVLLHAAAQESVAPEFPRPVNDAQSLVVPPVLMFALPVEVACDVPTLNAVMRAVAGGRALSTCRIPLAVPVAPSPATTVAMTGTSPSAKAVVFTSNAKSGGAAAALEAAKLVFPEARLTVATPVAARATTSMRTVPLRRSVGA